jgi:hypothetical protein
MEKSYNAFHTQIHLQKKEPVNLYFGKRNMQLQLPGNPIFKNIRDEIFV